MAKGRKSFRDLRDEITTSMMRDLMANPFSSMGFELQDISLETLRNSEYSYVAPEEEEEDPY